MRFSDLTPGYEFPSAVLALDAQTVERYLRATYGGTQALGAPHRQPGAVGGGVQVMQRASPVPKPSHGHRPARLRIRGSASR
jgi:hypothetical protein